ncbi:MAG: class I SAM-dependent methyltransferase [Bacillota bacterium]
MLLKSAFINLLLRIMIAFPGFVETFFFKKLMMLFPAVLSGRVDFDEIIAKEKNYILAFQKGLEKYQQVAEEEPEEILDLAAGTGVASLCLTNTFPEARVTGVDLAEEMLETARGKAEAVGFENVKFEKGDVYDLNMGEKKFDLVTVSNAPFSYGEVKKVLKENKYFLISLSRGGSILADKQDKITDKLLKYGFKVVEIEHIPNSGTYMLLRSRI